MLFDGILLVGIGLAGVCTHMHTCVGKDALRSTVGGGKRLETISISSAREGAGQAMVHPYGEYYASIKKTIVAVCEKDFQAPLKRKKQEELIEHENKGEKYREMGRNAELVSCGFITNHHSLGALKQQEFILTVLEARSLKYRC